MVRPVFVERVAFESVPAYARIDPDVLAEVRTRLLTESSALGTTLDAAFRTLERRQPAIAAFIAHDLASIDDPGVQGVAYFMAMLIVQAFEESFGRRLGCVELTDLHAALDRLITDGELRSENAPGPFYSEDAVALGQPAVVALLRKEFDAALELVPASEADIAASLDGFYETLLVLTVALTQVVAPR
jgi:hypothetical protein